MADAGSEQVDNEINLDQLKQLKEIFEAADEDGSGELDIDEFCTKLGPHLGVNLKPQQVAQLFMKIDADAGGTVDWDEFTNFMFLEKAQAGAGEGDADNWRLFPADFRDTNSSTSMHHEQVDKVYYCGAIDKYITCARDGTFRMWQAGDLDYVKSVNNGGSWITDCLYLPYSRKMVFTTMDRAITYYDIARGSYDLIGRVYASGAMGVPLTLHVLSGDAGERVVYGDSRGAAVLLLCGSRELPPRDLISTETHKDYIYLHEEHSDWITKIQWIPELGLVTSSLDATIKTFDINRERITHTCTHHTKGVHSFVWCHAYSCFASCGLERDVTVWHGTSGRKIGELRGHTSSVSHIALDPAHNHIFTLSLDKSIKVWDLRNHRCLQTITQDDWLRQSDSSPTCMMYDSNRCRLVTACHRPYVWQHQVITQDRTGHRDPVRGALYNDAFSVIVSVDEGATTCVWNLQDGAREERFNANACAAPCSGKDAEPCGACSSSNNCVTAISFDKNQRRLVMGTNSGAVTVWNFNNGSLLRRFSHDQEPLEVCEVLFAWDEKRSGDVVYAAGWNAKVFVWEDRDEDVVESYKTLEGHRSDILAMAAYAPRQLLASGDFQGRIIIWGLLSGERKSWVTYRSQFAGGGNSWCGSSMGGTGKADLGLYSGCGSSTVECSVERLLWIPAFSPQQRQAASEAAAALTTSAAALAAGSSMFTGLAAGASVRSAGAGAGSGGGVGDDLANTMRGRQQQQQPAGMLSSLVSSESLVCDMSSSNMQAGCAQHAQQLQHSAPHHGALPSPAAAADGSSSSRGPQDQQSLSHQPEVQQPQLGGEAGAEVEEPDALLLLATGGDSGVLLWQVDRLTQVTPLCTLPGAVGAHEVVTAAGLDEDATVVVLGDSTGHMRVLDISMGIDTSTPETAAASFKQRAHWQAHEGAIASVDIIPAKSSTLGSSSNNSDGGAAGAGASSAHGRSSSQVLILTGSRDCNVAVWTLDGGLVGVLGEHSWDLDDIHTWQDPQGLAKRPPKLQEPVPVEDNEHEILGEDQQAFASMAGGSVNGSSRTPGMLTSSGSRGSRSALTSGNRPFFVASARPKAAGAVAATGRGIPAHKGVKQAGRQQVPHQPQQEDHQLLPEQQQLSAELGGLLKASLIMQERKQKQREAMVTTSPQPHCQLRVHQLADINIAAGPGLRAASDSKHKQHAGPQAQQQHKSHSVGSSRHTAAGSRHLGSRPSGASSSWSGWTGA